MRTGRKPTRWWWTGRSDTSAHIPLVSLTLSHLALLCLIKQGLHWYENRIFFIRIKISEIVLQSMTLHEYQFKFNILSFCLPLAAVALIWTKTTVLRENLLLRVYFSLFLALLFHSVTTETN